MEPGDKPAAPSGPRLVLRLLVGSVMSALEDGGKALRELAPVAHSVGEPIELPALSARHVLVGALAVAPTWLTALMLQSRDAVAEPARRASRGLRAVTRFLPTKELSRWMHDLQTRAGTTALKLADLGRYEEQQGRALARAASGRLVGRVLDRVASSPELQAVIRDQSAGMGRSALTALRERSERADALAESVVDRLLPSRKAGNGHGPERG
jgi:hypothetical protein